MNKIINLHEITKYYQVGEIKNYVLNRFSCVFEENCFSVLAGPSGSGKSTLLNILATLDAPNNGEYTFNKHIVNFNDKKELTNIRKNNFGFIFQSFNLIPVLTALENVELPLTLFPISQQKRKEMSEKVLTLVGLKDKLFNIPARLSGGEQQRVAIARAIVRKPIIVFADEPTANLDKKNAIHIIELMKELNYKEKINFIIASHDDKIINAGKEVINLEE